MKFMTIVNKFYDFFIISSYILQIPNLFVNFTLLSNKFEKFHKSLTP